MPTQNKEERRIRSHPQHCEGVNQEQRSSDVGALRLFTGAVTRSFFCFPILLWGCFGISSNVHQLNEEIRDSEVRLIGSSGEQLGIMSADEALRIADGQGLDLVKISPQANPPVCKLMDYGKFRFEQSKREKEAR